MPVLPRTAPFLPGPRDAGLVLLAAVLALFLNGYGYGAGDSELYIPLVEHAADSARFAGDYLFSEPTAGANLWVPAMGFLNRFVPTQVLFFTGHLLSLILIFASVLVLARVLFKNRAAVLFAVLFLVSWKPVGGPVTRTLDSFFTLRMSAVPLSLFFLAAWFDKRHRLAALLAAATFLIHPLSGIVPAVLLVAGGFMDPRPGRFRRMTEALGLFALAVSPLAFRVLLSPGPHAFLFSADPAWLAQVRQHLPYHFLSLWKGEFFLQAGGYAGLLAAALVYRRLSGSSGEKDRLAWVLLAVCGGLFLAAWVFGDLVPVALAIELQLFRSPHLVVILAMAFAGWMAGEGARMAGGAGTGPGAAWRILQGMFPLFMAAVLLGRPEVQYQGIPVLAAGWGALYARKLSAAWRGGLGIVACAGAVSVLVMGDSPVHPAMALALGAAFLALEAARMWGKGLWPARGPAWWSWAAVSVAVALVSGARLADGSLFQALQVPGLAPENSWVRTAGWCRDHTPKDARFLVHPRSHGFRVFSGRSIVGNNKDGGPAVFSRSFLNEWTNRMDDLRGFDGFNAARFRALGEKYGAGYVVKAGTRVPGLTPLASDGPFTVYALF